MGTNYYAVKNKPTVRPPLHIGKSSWGWRFNFHACDEFHTFPQFRKWLDDHVKTGEYVLMDEYDEVVTVEDLLSLIESKQSNKNPDNFRYSRNVDGYRFSEGEFS